MKLDNECHNLDAYLSDDLSGNERAMFESHFEECPVCRDEVDQQRWIDDLLHSPARIQLETPSMTILDSFRLSVAQRRRRIRQATCGLAVAATLLIAFCLVEQNRQATEPSESAQQSLAAIEPVHAPVPGQQSATFDSTSDAIVVPLESPSDEVTIVQVYPTTDTERRWRVEAVLSNNL